MFSSIKKQKDWPHLRSFAEVHKLWWDWSIKVSFLFFSLCLLLFQTLLNLDVKRLMTLKWKFIERECITQWVTDFDIMLSEKICKKVQPNRMNHTRIWQPLMSYMIKLTSHFRDGLKLLCNTKKGQDFHVKFNPTLSADLRSKKQSMSDYYCSLQATLRNGLYVDYVKNYVKRTAAGPFWTAMSVLSLKLPLFYTGSYGGGVED